MVCVAVPEKAQHQLPNQKCMNYLLTVMDRYSRWLEAIPLPTITAKDCATALLRHWMARFGVPHDITTDQGPQFTSTLCADLMSLLGVKTLRTTANHPQANGMVERVHRALKEHLMASNARPLNWMDNLLEPHKEDPTHCLQGVTDAPRWSPF